MTARLAPSQLALADRWRAAVDKVAILAAEDPIYMPIFAAADRHREEAEAQDPAHLLRVKLARKEAA